MALWGTGITRGDLVCGQVVELWNSVKVTVLSRRDVVWHDVMSVCTLKVRLTVDVNARRV